MLVTVVLATAACGSSGDSGSSSPSGTAEPAASAGTSSSAATTATPATGTATSAGASSAAHEPVTLTMVTYDSFAASKDVLADFTKATGITVKLLPIGDTGETLGRVILTKDRPLGDVLWGVDNTYLSRAQEAGIAVPYASPELAAVDPSFTTLVPQHDFTPVDYGDVCVNVDHGWYAKKGLAEPVTLADLVKPEYRGQLVVEDPATSAPGLSFLLATVARYGEGGFEAYWKALRANDVAVTSGWTDAYTAQFSGSSGKGAAPARRLVRHQPAGGDARGDGAAAGAGDDRRAHGHLLPEHRVRRHPRRHEARGRGPHAGRLPALRALPGRHAAQDLRPAGAPRHAAARGLHALRRRAGDADDAAARRDRAASRRVDRDVEARDGRLSGSGTALPFGWLLALPPIAFLAALFGWPLVAILRHGVDPGTLADLVRDESLRRIAVFTVWQALASTAAALALGLPAAHAVARYRFPGRRLLLAVATVPFVLPTLIVGVAMLALLPASLEHSAWAIVAAHALVNAIIVVRIVGSFWGHLDPRYVEAARALGASPVRALVHVTLPLLRPALGAAATLVLSSASPRSASCSCSAGRRGRRSRSRSTAAPSSSSTSPARARSRSPSSCCSVSCSSSTRASRRGPTPHGGCTPSTRGCAGRARAVRRLGVAVGALILAVAVVAPLAALTWRSLQEPGGGYGLGAYRALARAPTGRC